MLLFPALIGVLCFSCIQAEEPNAEADIEECVILNANGQPDQNIKGKVVLTNTRIMAQATPYIDFKGLGLFHYPKIHSDFRKRGMAEGIYRDNRHFRFAD